MDNVFIISYDVPVTFLLFYMDVHGNAVSSEDLVLLVAKNKYSKSYIESWK